MIKRAIASRYSKVLFDLDLQKKVDLEKRLSDFEALTQLFKENPKLLYFLKSPQMSLQEKKEVLNSVLKEALDPLFLNFLFYLVEENKIHYLEQIALEYRFRVDAHLGIWEAKIVTAVPIEPDIQAILQDKLERMFQKKVKFNKEIDREIIGGVVLVVDNEMMDGSVATSLKKMKESLLVK